MYLVVQALPASTLLYPPLQLNSTTLLSTLHYTPLHFVNQYIPSHNLYLSFTPNKPCTTRLDFQYSYVR